MKYNNTFIIASRAYFQHQYAEAGHPEPLSDQLKQLVKLHKVAEQAMKGLIGRL